MPLVSSPTVRREKIKLIITHENSIKCTQFLFIYLFYLYNYPPDSQESDGGANT